MELQLFVFVHQSGVVIAFGVARLVERLAGLLILIGTQNHNPQGGIAEARAMADMGTAVTHGRDKKELSSASTPIVEDRRFI